MLGNRVVENTAAGRMSYGFNITFPSAPVMEIMARAGFEFVSFDSEHGPFTPDTLDDLCRVADGLGLTPMARVPDIEDSTILRFLDRGIMGILGPHVSTREKAERLVRACRFAPLGTRSMGSGRGAYYGDYPSTLEYMEHANANVLVMAQLEDVGVLDDLDGILASRGNRLLQLRPSGHSAVHGPAWTADSPQGAGVRGDRQGRRPRRREEDGRRRHGLGPDG